MLIYVCFFFGKVSGCLYVKNGSWYVAGFNVTGEMPPLFFAPLILQTRWTERMDVLGVWHEDRSNTKHLAHNWSAQLWCDLTHWKYRLVNRMLVIKVHMDCDDPVMKKLARHEKRAGRMSHSPSRQSFQYPVHPFSDCWLPRERQWALWYGIQILQEGPSPLWTHQLGKTKDWLEFDNFTLWPHQ